MKKNTRKLTETAVMLALSTVLSLITVYKAPFGGSVTPASMLPVILIAFRYGGVWGLFACFIHGVIQMLLGVGEVATWGLSPAVFAGSVIFDYLLAFGLLGTAGFFKSKKFGLQLGTATAIALRFVCHFLSGFILFGHFAEGMNPVLYSLLYNGAYMLPELIVTLLIVSVIQRFPSVYEYLTNPDFSKSTETR